MKTIKQLLEENDMPPEHREYFQKLFDKIPHQTVEHIVSAKAKKGDYILKAGEPCEAVYFLLKGKVAGETYTDQGSVYSFLDFSQMYVLGDYEMLYDSAEHVISIKAEQDCNFLKLSRDHYINWIKQDVTALYLRTKNILSVLSFERRVDREFMQKNSKERLCVLLVRFYEVGTKDKNGNHTVRHTQSELADKIGVNLRSVQRSIAALEREQLVQLKKGKMVISQEQYEKLAQMSK
jgi:CRP-like cAMP-binding protein